MFKKYEFKYKGSDRRIHRIEFCVKSRRSCMGVSYKATFTGFLPRLDGGEESYLRYCLNSLKITKRKKFSVKRAGIESWPGQKCLKGLWDRLGSLPFVDMQRICGTNPFEAFDEPDHEDLIDPDDVFDT